MITALALILVVFTNAESECRWNIASNLTLDLRPLEGKILSTLDTMGFNNYTFSVCSNELSCDSSKKVMVAQNELDSNYCFYLAIFDPDIQPTYANIDGEESWAFEYPNGESQGTFCNRTWLPTFICDPTTEYSLSDVSEGFVCQYSVEIRSKYACPDYTTTTTLGPNSECIFKSNNRTLDISSVRGDILSYKDNTTSDDYFYYTPCENYAKCDNVPTMAYIFNAKTISCEQYLAVWEDGIVTPQYISSLDSWQFTYTNGEKCGPNNTPSIFQVEWLCDGTAVTPRVASAQQIAECVYQMIVYSVLACS